MKAAICSTVVAVVILVTLAHFAMTDQGPLRLKVDPHIALPPADVRIVIHTGSHPANAWVDLTFNGPDYYRNSLIPLFGDKGPATLDAIWYKRVPGGEYQIEAVLYRHDGRTWEAGRAVERIQIGTLEP